MRPCGGKRLSPVGLENGLISWKIQDPEVTGTLQWILDGVDVAEILVDLVDVQGCSIYKAI